MNFIKTAVLGAVLSLGAIAAQAATYNFAYSFDPANTGNGEPVSITGTFTGTAIGDLISNIADVSLSINGIAFHGPIFVESADVDGNPSNTIMPVISADVGKSNFVFSDVDMVANPYGYSNFFTIYSGTAYGVNLNATDAMNNALIGFETADGAHWTVTAAAVPEPSSIALMLAGLGFVGLRSLRRRQA